MALEDRIKQLEREIAVREKEIRELRFLERLNRTGSVGNGSADPLVVSSLELGALIVEWMDEYESATGDRSRATEALAKEAGVASSTIRRIYSLSAKERTRFTTLTVANKILMAMNREHETSEGGAVKVVTNPLYAPSVDED